MLARGHELLFIGICSFLQLATPLFTKALNFQEKDILEYASQSLQSKPSILWLLPPVLTAAAIPPRWAYFLPQGCPFKFTSVIILMVVWCCNGLYRSTMFQIYLAQIGKQFHEAAPADRYVIKEWVDARYVTFQIPVLVHMCWCWLFFRKCCCRGDGIEQHRNCK